MEIGKLMQRLAKLHSSKKAERLELKQEIADQLIAMRKEIGPGYGTRDWCYFMEPQGLDKSNFDAFEKLLSSLRKADGEQPPLLPVDFAAEDVARQFQCLETLDSSNAEDEQAVIKRSVDQWIDNWNPDSFWDEQSTALFLFVEKIGLVTLFKEICSRYKIPVCNSKGWSDINSRARFLRMAQPHLAAGRDVVMLYCGDFDPAGIRISNKLVKNLTDLEGAFFADGVKLRGTGRVKVHRFGLSFEQIQEYRFPWIDNLLTGKRPGRKQLSLGDRTHPNFADADYQRYFRDYCEGELVDDVWVPTSPRKCEANVLVTQPDVANRLLLDAIHHYIDINAVELFEEQRQMRVDTELRPLFPR